MAAGTTRLEIRTAAHARQVFPLVFRTAVTDTLAWDGPENEKVFVRAWREHGRRTLLGEAHEFAIVDASDGTAIGALSVRPGPNPLRGDVGMFVGIPHQGRGHGTRAVRLAVEYAFGRLRMEKFEATVFVGNEASRRVFERNGFRHEGTRRKSMLKRGVWRDEWLFGITREEFEGGAGGDIAPRAGA